MSVYNAERYVAAAVSSILAQSWRDLELIIVDDGSSDGTPGQLNRLAADDERILVIRQANQGLTRSLNIGAARAQGRYLARMDADDVALPDRFAMQVRFLSRHPEHVAVGSSLLLIDPDGDALAEQVPPLTHEAIVSQLWQGTGAIPHPSAMMLRAAFERVGGYREQFVAAQDLDLWLRMAEAGRLANLPETLLRYRLHAGAVTVQRRQLQLRCAEQAVRDAKRRRGDPQPDSFALVAGRPCDGARALRGWARMALKSRHVAVARKHAWTAFRHRPWSPAHWWLLARAWSSSPAAGQ